MKTRTLTTLIGFGAAGSLALGACSSGASAGGESGGSSESTDGEITLTVATFNEFDYDDLYAEYMETHPGIKVIGKKAATSNDARDNMNTRLAAGSGLADVEAIEVDWLPELMQYPDKFADLFAKAGLPTERNEVAALLEGDWDTYFSVGKNFVAKTGIPWFDSATGTYQGMLNQVENPFEKNDNSIIPLKDNTAIKAVYDQDLQASTSDGLSAGFEQWSEDWVNAFQNDGFATMLCPPWMLGVIEGNAAGVTGWDVAPVYPGGGGNWGDSYLTVPAQGAHIEEATELAAWLTTPEQQIKAFKAKGTFPSQVDALSSDELLSYTNEFFNNAPVGQIYSDMAKKITVQPHKGPNFFAITVVVTDAINRVDVAGADDPASS